MEPIDFSKFVYKALLIGCEQIEAESAHEVEIHSISADSYDVDLDFAERYFDCLVFSIAPDEVTNIENLISPFMRFLSLNGSIYLCVSTIGKYDAGDIITNANPLLYGIGLDNYIVCISEDSTFLTIILKRNGYDPVSHARARFKAGHPGEALEILCSVPEERYRNDPELYVRLSTEKMLCYLAWGNTGDDIAKLFCFSHGQVEFFKVAYNDPLYSEAYMYQAEFWHRIGNDDMAVRTLRSLNHVAPSKMAQEQICKYESDSTPQSPTDSEPMLKDERSLCVTSTGRQTPRILIITHEKSDCSMDTLYDGLCTILGPDNVVEYPWKPFLHGEHFDKTVNYPSTFNHPGKERTAECIEQELIECQYDIILYGDMFHFTDRDEVLRILAAAGDLPLFIVDTWDEPTDNRADNLLFLERDSVNGIFKREMLECFDYGENVFPFPLSYPDKKIFTYINWQRTEDLFWAGHRIFGLRRLYLERLELILGRDLNQQYSQEEYSRALLNAGIGLDMFGNGYGTMRYFEIPAHGCMLLAERVPIRISNNFRDGVSAVFYNDLKELEEKLDYYICHKEECVAIARAGHEHLKQYHTASARARQVLGRIEDLLSKQGP